MRRIRQSLILIVGIMAVTTLTGCTNWEKKYGELQVENQNLQGLYENCVASLDSSASEKTRLGQRLSQSQQEIAKLQNQLKNKKPADTGFKGDVKIDEKAGTITVTLPNAILFSAGKASLLRATNDYLDHIYSVIRQRYSGKTIDIVGHTDSDPIRKSKKYWKDNWELSAERSLTVVRYLVNRGIRKDKIRAVACGESRPVASNSTSSGKAKNRRVEVVVHMY